MDKYKFQIGQEVSIFSGTDMVGIIVGKDSYSPDDTHWYAVRMTKGGGDDRYLPVREDLLAATPNLVDMEALCNS